MNVPVEITGRLSESEKIAQRPSVIRMPRKRTRLEAATGRLISAIQKEWAKELGQAGAEVSQEVMNRAHDLLKAVKEEQVEALLGGNSVSEFLGSVWVEQHPSVKPSIASLESALETIHNV